MADSSNPTLTTTRSTLLERRQQLLAAIAEIDQHLQDICLHEWRWWPVAGEGRYCPHCGARDYSED